MLLHKVGIYHEDVLAVLLFALNVPVSIIEIKLIVLNKRKIEETESFLFLQILRCREDISKHI